MAFTKRRLVSMVVAAMVAGPAGTASADYGLYCSDVIDPIEGIIGYECR